MRNKEVAHWEAENVRDRVEAEKINQRMIESKRIDTELLQAEAKVIALKVQLAQLNARLGGLDPSVSPGALVPHTTLSSSSGFSADQLSAAVLEYLMMGEELATPSQRYQRRN
ncbi:hypothetical protein JVT61DRAFT_8789 [Boletus reticuloceps]|uniref:Uncharacterized protein n=1 Tax=Boletus reticuloceps TaxID=495285 RepID=A0A8I3A763_9AGAM|nr:hypothetical protein JVT61DRAFT_8789 [Boletus reticuloceps]